MRKLTSQGKTVRMCRAKTRLGNRCIKPASRGSLACSIPKHIEEVEKNYNIRQWAIRSWCRIPNCIKITTGSVGSVGLIIGIFAIFQTCYYGEKSPSKSDLKGTEDRVIENQQDSKQEIIDAITKKEKINRDRLEREYPLGYVIIYAGSGQLKEVKRELTQFPSQNIHVDWSKSRTRSVTEEYVDVDIPDMVYSSPEFNGRFRNISMRIKRMEGEKQWGKITLKNVTFWAEVLVNEEDTLAFVIGFGPAN